MDVVAGGCIFGGIWTIAMLFIGFEMGKKAFEKAALKEIEEMEKEEHWFNTAGCDPCDPLDDRMDACDKCGVHFVDDEEPDCIICGTSRIFTRKQ